MLATSQNAISVSVYGVIVARKSMLQKLFWFVLFLELILKMHSLTFDKNFNINIFLIWRN